MGEKNGKKNNIKNLQPTFNYLSIGEKKASVNDKPNKNENEK